MNYHLKNEHDSYFVGFFYDKGEVQVITVSNRDDADFWYDKKNAEDMLNFITVYDYNQWRIVRTKS
jgi:hypothetical protein